MPANESGPALSAPAPRAPLAQSGRSWRTASGCLLVAALIIAPLAFGATRRGPWIAVTAITAAGGIAWIVAGISSGTCRLPPVPARIGAALAAMVGLVWLLALTQPEAPAFTVRHLARLTARWPDSIVLRTLPLIVAWAGASILALVALADLASGAPWRRAIAAAMLLTGAAVALLGLVQNATHATGIYWSGTHRMPGAFFGTFFHHTAAGAYLNSVWPLGVASLGARDRRASLPWALAGLACAVLVLAAHAGHVSRFPQVIAVAILAALVLWFRPGRAASAVRAPWLALGAATGVLLLGLLVLRANRLGDIRSRWEALGWTGIRGGGPAVEPAPPDAWPRLMRDDLFVPSDHQAYPLGDRGAAYAAAIHAVAEHPWLGWGPGGWTAAAAAHSLDPFVRTFFLMVQFTHEDYLQTWLEWGIFGALGWALLVPGAVLNALVRLGRQPWRDPIGAGAAAALAAVLIQSLIDFPLQIPAVQGNAIALAALAWSVPSRPAVSPS